MSNIPSLYVGNRKLFPRMGLHKRDVEKTLLPDPAEENLQPDQEDLDDDVKAKAEKAFQDLVDVIGSPEKAHKALRQILVKAGAAQESGGRTTFPLEDAAKRDSESLRYSRGVGDAETPDLPESGRDWHGTVPGVPDVPKDEKPGESVVDIGKTPQEEAAGYKKLKDQNEETKKAMAGAPRFSPGPFTAPREAEFLLQYGYTPEEVQSGDFRIAPWMRAEFNRQQMGVVYKSLSSLAWRLRR
jgi:hypothetical protein